MPNPFIKAVENQTGEKKSRIEGEYQKVENYAKKKGVNNPWAYATATVERMNPSYRPKDKK